MGRTQRLLAGLLLVFVSSSWGDASEANEAAQTVPTTTFSGVAVWVRDETPVVVRIDSGQTPLGAYYWTTVEGPNERVTLCWRNRCRTELAAEQVVLEADWDVRHQSVPALSRSLRELAQWYEVTPLPEQSWQGHPANGWLLQPRDAWRYPQRWWLDAATGVTLERTIFDDAMTPLERFAFVRFERHAQADLTEVRQAWSSLGQSDRVDFRLHTVAPDAMPWRLDDLPPGFALRASGWRQGPSGSRVWQWALSDGAASVSLFVEQAPSQHARDTETETERPGAAIAESAERGSAQRWGATLIVRRNRNGWLQTAVGEVPAATLHRLLDGMRYVDE